MNRYWIGDHANMPGLSGEIMRACYAFEGKMKAELDAQVRRPGEIPCTACRRPTPITELRGAPGRWTCTTCAAPAAPNTGAEAPQEDEMAKQIPMSREEREMIVQLHQQGTPRAEIEQRVGRSRYAVATVIRRLEEEGLEAATAPARIGGGRVDALTAAEEARILSLRGEGQTHEQIARETGRSVSAVARTCAANPSTAERTSDDPIRPDYTDPLDAAELERLRRANAELEQGAAEAVEALEEIKRDYRDALHARDVARGDAAEARRRLAEGKAQAAPAAELLDLQRRLDESLSLEVQLGRDLAAREADLAALREEHASACDDLGKLHTLSGNQYQTIEQLRAELARLEEAQEAMQREAVEAIHAAEADRAAARKRLAEVEAEASSTLREYRERVARLAAERDAAIDAVDAPERSLGIANRQTAEMRDERDEALKWVARLEAERDRLAAQLDHAKASAAEADKLRGLLEIAKRQLAERQEAEADGPYRRHWLAQRESRRAAAELEAARERAAEAAAELEDAEVEAERAQLRDFMTHPEMPHKLATALQGVATAAAKVLGVAS